MIPEQEVLTRMAALKAGKQNPQAIADTLNKEKLFPNRIKEWTKKAVGNYWHRHKGNLEVKGPAPTAKPDIKTSNSDHFTLDRAEAERYLKMLDSSTDTFHFAGFHDDSTKKRTMPGQNYYDTLDAVWPKLVELNRKGYGIFVTVNKTNGKGRKASDIVAARALWIDDDSGKAKLSDDGTFIPSRGELPLRPSMVVESSPGNYHGYWITQTDNLDEWQPVQKNMVAYGCDPGATDSARVLRLPGFCHQKINKAKGLSGERFMVRVVYQADDGVFDWSKKLKAAFKPSDITPCSDKPPDTATDDLDSAYANTVDMPALTAAVEYLKDKDHFEARNNWINTGLALKTAGEDAYELWLSISDDAKEAEEQWSGFNPTQTGWRSILKKAQKRGWKNRGTESEQEKIGGSMWDEDGEKKSQVTLLIEIASGFKLFHDQNGDAYAEIDHTGYTEIMQVQSRVFKELLSSEFYKRQKKGVSTAVVKDALATIEAKAKHDNGQYGVFTRVCQHESAIYIDMGCPLHRVIEVDAKCWKILDKSPVKFVRKTGMTALPEPSRTASDITLMYDYINVSDQDRPLVTGWMLCALAGVKPYPILILQGEQGSGKSSTSRAIRSFVDPSTVPLRAPPKDSRDFQVSASHTHVVALDNLSGITPELSDTLCRLSTGGGMDNRALYTDSDLVLIDLQKPVMVNGIDEIGTRPDLAERAVTVHLPMIADDQRKTEDELKAKSEKNEGIIFAALLDGLVSGLKHLDSVKLKEKPRMADATQWITACEKSMGILPSQGFIQAHARNQDEAIDDALEASPVGSAIMALMKDKDKEEWEGTATDLFSAVRYGSDFDSEVFDSKAWPKSAKGLKNTIERLQPNFRKRGIHIERFRASDGMHYRIRGR